MATEVDEHGRVVCFDHAPETVLVMRNTVGDGELLDDPHRLGPVEGACGKIPPLCGALRHALKYALVSASSSAVMALAPTEWVAGSPLHACQASQVYFASMATTVLRVRLVGGEHTDLTYEDPDYVDEGEMVDQIIEVLTADTGVLRCRHGNRLIALYARGVASIEVSPRGAIV